MSVSLAPQDPWIKNAACERTFRTLRTLVCALMSSGDDIRLHDSDIEEKKQLFPQFMWMYSHDDLGEWETEKDWEYLLKGANRD